MTIRTKNRRSARAETLEYRLIFASAFLLYLAAAPFRRLWPAGAEAPGAAAGAARTPIVHEAWSAAHAAAGYAFMA